MAAAMSPAARLPAAITGRRGRRSARAPPTGDSSPIGRKAPAATRTAQLAWPVREMTRAPTATVCIQVPTLDTRLAVHRTAKLRWRNGWSAVSRFAAGLLAAVTTLTLGDRRAVAAAR